MSSTQHDSSVSDKIDVASKIGLVIGIDGHGDVHVHYGVSGKIAVYEVPDDYEVGDYLAGEPKIEQELEGRPLSEWMSYVEHERGGWLDTTNRAPARPW